MIKTYRKVLRDIKPGDTWESIGNCNIKSISYIDSEIRIEFDSRAIYHALNDNAQFRLKKEEIEFQKSALMSLKEENWTKFDNIDAIKALKVGKTIESCETLSLYKIKRQCSVDSILSSRQDSPTWLDLDCNFKTKEVLGKWCIYEEGEI